MFYYKKEKDKYYIWSDEISGKFWPFVGVFVKNKFLWKVLEKYKNLEKEYPWYKFSFWIWEEKIFILWKKGIEKIFEKK